MSADFDDGKDAGALRTIGEVSDALGIKPHVLRYWEQQFPMLSPLKRSGGRRYYRSGDIAVVEAINQLVNVDGYTLKGAKAALKAADRRKDDRRKGDRRLGGEEKEAAVETRFTNRSAEEALSLAEAIPQLKAVRAKLAAIVEAG
jgi:DNA-binding transcriptional MerR regulator